MQVFVVESFKKQSSNKKDIPSYLHIIHFIPEEKDKEALPYFCIENHVNAEDKRVMKEINEILIEDFQQIRGRFICKMLNYGFIELPSSMFESIIEKFISTQELYEIT